MKKHFKYLFLLTITCHSFFFISAQDLKTDSLQSALKKNIHDTTRLTLLLALVENSIDDKSVQDYSDVIVKLGEKLIKSNNELIIFKAKKSIADAYDINGLLNKQHGNMPKALKYHEMAMKLRTDINDKGGIASSLVNLGVYYENAGNTITAIDYYFKALKIQEALGLKQGAAASLNNIGAIYSNQGDIVKALEYYSKSLKIKEAIGYKEGTATCLINIGAIYESLGNTQEALNNYKASIKLLSEINSKTIMAGALNNIGALYKNKGKIDSALFYYQKSLTLYEKSNDKLGIARSYNNLASVYKIKNDTEKSMEYYFKSLLQFKELNDKKGTIYAFLNLGQAYLKLKRYPVARAYADSSAILSAQLKFPEVNLRLERFLTKIDSATGDFKGAYNHYKKFILYKDSLNNETTRKAGIKNQLKYEFEKKEAVIKEQQEKERAIAEEKNRFQKIVIASVLLGLLLVIVFAALVFRSLKVTKQQKVIIEEKQKEILDSIRYAKRIQTSLLPTEKYIEKNIRSN